MTSCWSIRDDKQTPVVEHMLCSITRYEIENRSVYNILDQICKDTDLYLYVKQHKSKRVGRGAFYAIHSRLQGLNYMNVTASEAELALQTLTYGGEIKAWNWEKYVACHIKYLIILVNLMEYEISVYIL